MLVSLATTALVSATDLSQSQIPRWVRPASPLALPILVSNFIKKRQKKLAIVGIILQESRIKRQVSLKKKRRPARSRQHQNTASKDGQTSKSLREFSSFHTPWSSVVSAKNMSLCAQLKRSPVSWFLQAGTDGLQHLRKLLQRCQRG